MVEIGAMIRYDMVYFFNNFFVEQQFGQNPWSLEIRCCTYIELLWNCKQRQSNSWCNTLCIMLIILIYISIDNALQDNSEVY